MRPKAILFAILSLLFLTIFTPAPNLNVNEQNIIISYNESNAKENSFRAVLTYVRVLENGKWWIYVYESGKLVDVYPE